VSGAGFLAVGVGAALGAWLRWFLGVALNAVVPELPLGTLAANLVGGYLIGLAVGVFEAQASLAPELRLFVVTGFLGGLTTFSAFSGEAVALLMSERYGWAAMHVGAHLAGSLALTALGIVSARALIQ
jgi:CrcB protein